MQVHHSSPGLPYRQSRKSAAARVSLSRRLPAQTAVGRAVPAAVWPEPGLAPRFADAADTPSNHWQGRAIA